VDWSDGRYERIGGAVLAASEVVVDAASPMRGEMVVDLGCGDGNAALLAAARGARVTGIDPARRLLEVAAVRATERSLDATFLEGVADAMPVEDAAADAIVSVFGVIFAPTPTRPPKRLRAWPDRRAAWCCQPGDRGAQSETSRACVARRSVG
jgi:ubiquinone/menaquinone biosynthesis C-methylase UbiE